MVMRGTNCGEKYVIEFRRVFPNSPPCIPTDKDIQIFHVVSSNIYVMLQQMKLPEKWNSE